MRCHSFDCFKFLAMVGVIIAHLPPGGRFDSATWATIELAQKLSGWCVLAFFVVSGALLQSGISREPGPELARRAKRLLVPWLSFSLFYKILVCGLAFGGVIKNTQQIPPDASNLWQWLINPADPQLYFLVFLFFMQACLLLLHRLAGVAPILAGCAALALWYLFVWPGSSLKMLHGANWELVPLYFAFLAFGLFCGRSFWRVAMVCLVLCLLAGVAILRGCDPVTAGQFAAPWLVLLVLRAFERLPGMSVWAALGQYSGVVYVWHAPLIVASISIACVAVIGGGLFSAALTIAMTFAVSAAVGVWVARVSALRCFHI
jgi:fucose 4-O-acetylase-like acetyltransferase